MPVARDDTCEKIWSFHRSYYWLLLLRSHRNYIHAISSVKGHHPAENKGGTFKYIYQLILLLIYTHTYTHIYLYTSFIILACCASTWNTKQFNKQAVVSSTRTIQDTVSIIHHKGQRQSLWNSEASEIKDEKINKLNICYFIFFCFLGGEKKKKEIINLISHIFNLLNKKFTK